MSFNSLAFLLFFPVVLILLSLCPKKYRWMILLVASYYFYMSWNAKYAALIAFSTLVDYVMAILISKSNNYLRKVALIISLACNLGLLFLFKYYNFFREELLSSLQSAGIDHYFPWLWFALPVGISFYTFQTLSYTIDVYRGTQKPEKHLGIFALYVSFFPQLVAGPIEKFSNLGRQLKEEINLTYPNLVLGFRLMLYGFFIKMCIADNISPLVDQAYNETELLDTLDLWWATFLYSFQIYADFHGYSTIAIGAAQVMGIHLMDNFKNPYSATSITEFWKKWHISLTSWFRDYLYIPLGGNRVSKTRWIVHIFVVFLLSGLWHGAHYTFLIWGGIHAVFYFIERFLPSFSVTSSKPVLLFFTRSLLTIKTFVVVSLAWVFFRSDSVPDALQFLKRLFSWQEGSETFSYYYAFPLLMILFILFEVKLNGHRISNKMNLLPKYLRFGLYTLLLLSVMIWSGAATHSFIYFQF